MVGLVIALCVVTVALGERIGINQGQGWDGMGYTSWAQAFRQHVLTEGIPRYYSQRILPSAIVSFGLGGTGAHSSARVIEGFQVLDSLCLVLSSVLWTRIALTLGWSRLSAWVGFAALFLSFAVLRHALYYPTLTDSSAILLGASMVHGYVGNRRLVLFATAAAGLFAWPAIVPSVVLMVIYPRSSTPAPAAIPGRRRVAAGLGCAAALAYVVISIIYYRAPLHAAGFDKFQKWIHPNLVVVTLIVIAITLFAATTVLFSERSAWNPKRAWEQAGWGWRTLLGLALGFGVLLVARGWWIHRVGTRGEGPTMAEFICQQALEALRGPLWGLVHHCVYFGPIVILAILAWRRIAAVAAAWGPGAILSMAAVVAFAPSSESRQWVHLLPLLVAITITATRDLWSRRAATVFILCALLWSDAWLRIGYDAPGDWFEFPTQRYFMHMGPWASDGMYVVHLIAALVTGVVLFATVAVARPPGAREPRDARAR